MWLIYQSKKWKRSCLHSRRLIVLQFIISVTHLNLIEPLGPSLIRAHPDPEAAGVQSCPEGQVRGVWV